MFIPTCRSLMHQLKKKKQENLGWSEHGVCANPGDALACDRNHPERQGVSHCFREEKDGLPTPMDFRPHRQAEYMAVSCSL